MKKLISVFIAILFIISVIPMVIAQDTEAAETEEIEGNPGITPDNVLHGLDRALERIRYAMTIGSKRKATYGLKIAEERLLEAQAMAKTKKIAALVKAKNNYGLALGKVKKDIDNMVSDDPEQELDGDTEIETEIEENEEKMDKFVSFVDLNIMGELTEEQKEKLTKLLDSFENETEDLKIKIDEKRLKTILKYKIKLGKDDEEVNTKLEELREKHNLTELRKDHIEKQIERLERKIAKLEEITDKAEENGKDVTLMRQRLEEAAALTGKIKEAVEDKDLEEIKELIKKANQLLNFRQAYMALGASKDKTREKLKELDEQRIEKREEIKEKLEELKEKRSAKKEAEETEEEEAEELDEEQESEEEIENESEEE